MYIYLSLQYCYLYYIASENYLSYLMNAESSKGFTLVMFLLKEFLKKFQLLLLHLSFLFFDSSILLSWGKT